MAIFPRVQSPCPYQGNLASVMDGDMCRACKRQVFDLTAMTDGERVAFMDGCATEVCVSYKLPLAALAMAATLGAPMAAAAQEAASVDMDNFVLIVGGVKDVANVEYIEVSADNALPELPAIYEDAAGEENALPAMAAQATPISSPSGT